jgi:hypothetical protein
MLAHEFFIFHLRPDSCSQQNRYAAVHPGDQALFFPGIQHTKVAEIWKTIWNRKYDPHLYGSLAMKTPEQLKGAIHNMAANHHLRAQEVMQMFLFERIWEQLAVSPYRNSLILKGRLLISSMRGIRERTTMDMDTSVRGISMEEERIVSIVHKILALDVGDGIKYVFQKIEPIREDDACNNFRVHLEAIYGKIHAPMKMDVTTGDKITSAVEEYENCFLFEEKYVPIMAYTLETILAENMRPLSAVTLAPPEPGIFMIYIPFSM